MKKRAALPGDLKRTKPRQAVLQVMEQAQTPQSALEIFEAVRKEGEKISISTVYRTLDTLVQKRAVDKTTFPGTETAVFELVQRQHRHYAVCMDCRQVVSVENCPMEAFTPLLQESGFQVTGHKVELYGYCADCGKHTK